MPSAPFLVCYDGSDDAKLAIAESARLLEPRHALVVTIWQTTAAMPTYAWAGGEGAVDALTELFDAVRDGAARVAAEGAALAVAQGLDAEPLAVEAQGPVWAALVDTAKERDVSAIVMGSRGLSGLKSALLGSVSGGVLHHATRPVVIVRRSDS